MAMLDIIKKAGMGAVQAGNPVAVTYATVSQVHPLELYVDQKSTLTEDFLIVPEHMKEYKVTVGDQEVVIRKGLERGDKLILIRAQGGQSFVIVGRVTGS
ncbi:DUF2577 domain-containing protein [Paenibacillus sp. J2TS4]|uniref:DUF2577 domain-containing protein n=1 Tax=Paenibacillus sp. J2TS4 TaxID=2807194 RepID=UPI001B2D7879|nr:DUF2577 domain-containing protein [Paenibacillus sp. J2TS4]GIP35511.1 hypothetical protein J2TS4_47210 [Paenibacillus sp. J2TS4]